MDSTSFRILQTLAYEKAGISLASGKEALLEARIASRIRELGMTDERAYVAFLSEDRSGGELVHFLNAISTNFTSFFREPDHFEEMCSYVLARVKQGQRRFRFWSAACSSGEEPFSMALALAETLAPLPDVDWRILASDLSTRVLATASLGRFTQAQIQAIPEGLRKRYLLPVRGEPGLFEVDQALRDRIALRRLNLATPPYPMNGPLDVVFCRNVMIYFDTAVRQGVVAEAERLLAPGGLFLIGHSETLTGVEHGLELVEPSVYRRRP